MNEHKVNELNEIGRNAYNRIVDLVNALNDADGKDDDELRNSSREAIENDPLDVSVRSDWYSFSMSMYERGEPVEYRILLSTGGPATRIVGDLEDGDPTSAYLEVQDWGTPWTRTAGFGENEQAILLQYARCFYFGE